MTGAKSGGTDRGTRRPAEEAKAGPPEEQNLSGKMLAGIVGEIRQAGPEGKGAYVRDRYWDSSERAPKGGFGE